MKSAVAVLFGLLLTLSVAGADTERLKLRGFVAPPVDQARIFISSVEQPYRGEAKVSRGKFQFKQLPPGTYTLTLEHPDWGELRRTVAVTAGRADKKGRVDVEFPVRSSQTSHSRKVADDSVVSLRELRIPPKAYALRRQALEALEQGDEKRAIARLQRAVEIAPDLAEAWNTLGTLANTSRDFATAEQYFRTALEKDPAAFAPLVNLGGVVLAQGRYDEAIELNQEAVEARDDDALAHAQLGMAHFFRGDKGEAMRHLLRARQLDPAHFTHPQLFLAEIHASGGRLEQAAWELEQLMKLHPNSNAAARAEAALEELEKRLNEQAP